MIYLSFYKFKIQIHLIFHSISVQLIFTELALNFQSTHAILTYKTLSEGVPHES